MRGHNLADAAVIIFRRQMEVYPICSPVIGVEGLHGFYLLRPRESALLFFVVLFYGPFLLSSMPAPIDSRSLRHYVTYFGLIASLAFVNRIDTVLLFAPALSYIVFKSVRLLKWRLTGPILIGAAPALAWLLFSLVYYGFPFPNTYYAKSAYIGIAAADFLRQGFAYYINSLAWDPQRWALLPYYWC